jgi:hypothetical protein
MAQVCAHCGSAETQTLARSYHCLICGKHTNYTDVSEDKG